MYIKIKRNNIMAYLIEKKYLSIDNNICEDWKIKSNQISEYVARIECKNMLEKEPGTYRIRNTYNGKISLIITSEK
jgi:hypothetical protein